MSAILNGMRLLHLTHSNNLLSISGKKIRLAIRSDGQGKQVTYHKLGKPTPFIDYMWPTTQYTRNS